MRTLVLGAAAVLLVGCSGQASPRNADEICDLNTEILMNPTEIASKSTQEAYVEMREISQTVLDSSGSDGISQLRAELAEELFLVYMADLSEGRGFGSMSDEWTAAVVDLDAAC